MSTLTLEDIANQLLTLRQAALEEWKSWQANPVPNPNFPYNPQWAKEKERRRRETWYFHMAAGGILWVAFEYHYPKLDGRFRAIIGSWRGRDRAFHNPEWAKGRSFEDICYHWLEDSFDGISYQWKSVQSGEMLATIQALQLLSEYFKSIQ